MKTYKFWRPDYDSEDGAVEVNLSELNTWDASGYIYNEEAKGNFYHDDDDIKDGILVHVRCEDGPILEFRVFGEYKIQYRAVQER